MVSGNARRVWGIYFNGYLLGLEWETCVLNGLGLTECGTGECENAGGLCMWTEWGTGIRDWENAYRTGHELNNSEN